MKKFSVLVCLLALAAALALPARGEAEDLRIGALTGPTSMGMVGLWEDAPYCVPTVLGSADELVPRILKEEVDIAALPANLAATLYSKTQGQVVALAVNVLGVLYIGEYNSQSLQSLADLKGKTLYATGKGSTPEYFLRYLLSQNGLDPDKDVTIQWKSQPSEVVALLNARQSGIAMLPQPYVTAAAAQLGEGFRVSLSLSQEWEKLDNGTLCTTAVVVARREYVRNHPEEVAAFLENLADSVAWVTENPDQAAELCEAFGVIQAPVAKKAIPACNLVCITGEAMHQALSGCLKVIYDQNPQAVGGAMPGDDFYYGA